MIYFERQPDGSYEIFYTNPALNIAWVVNTTPDDIDGAIEAIVGDTLEYAEFEMELSK